MLGFTQITSELHVSGIGAAFRGEWFGSVVAQNYVEELLHETESVSLSRALDGCFACSGFKFNSTSSPLKLHVFSEKKGLEVARQREHVKQRMSQNSAGILCR